METDYHSAKGYLQQEHYYGTYVRKLLIFGGLIMLLALPFFSDLIPGGLDWSIPAIIVVVFGAGLLNPLLRWVVALNLGISFLATVIFEYESVISYHQIVTNIDKAFFVTNQVLALIFFFATYYGAKSLRGFFVRGKILS